MNILYIGYWSVNDGLSEASIKPTLDYLSTLDQVETIFYASIERENSDISFNWKIDKVNHIPFYSPHRPFLRDKIDDFTTIPKHLARICKKHSVKFIICRSAPAGAIGYFIHKIIKTKYIVESFEPHADYMRASGVWSVFDVRYWIQKYFEKRQIQTAHKLITVSENYRNHLITKNVESKKLSVIPCSVSVNNFGFDDTGRIKIRKLLGVSNRSLIGIYVGKLGGIYYEHEAVNFIKYCFKNIENFYLLILSPQAKNEIEEKLIKQNLPISRLMIKKVSHDEVAKYLSASDIAFCLHRSHDYSIAYSPIKNGEYFANGLPIFIGKNIGDDSNLIQQSGAGLVVDYQKNPSESLFRDIKNLIQASNADRKNNNSVRIARNFRSEEKIKLVYSSLLNVPND